MSAPSMGWPFRNGFQSFWLKHNANREGTTYRFVSLEVFHSSQMSMHTVAGLPLRVVSWISIIYSIGVWLDSEVGEHERFWN